MKKLNASEADVLKRLGVIPAIKAYRERTGASLLESKRVVDEHRGRPAPSFERTTPTLALRAHFSDAPPEQLQHVERLVVMVGGTEYELHVDDGALQLRLNTFDGGLCTQLVVAPRAANVVAIRGVK